jgi:ribonuclease-3
LQFKVEQDNGLDPYINYCATILYNRKALVKARDHSKKKAEENAARRAYYKLQISA